MENKFSPPKNFSISAIRSIRKELKAEAAGNSRCTMTDLDLACDMLDELIKIKETGLTNDNFMI